MIRLVFFFCLSLLAASVQAHEEHTHAAAVPAAERAPLAASAAFDAQGRLWRVTVQAGQVRVDRSDDQGASFSAPVTVNPQPEKVGAEGELRPKLALGRNGEVYVSWTQALDRPYAGHIRFSRSLDGGRSFSAPVVVNRDQAPITHRFDALAVADDGTIYVAWIDKRDLEAAKAAGAPYRGAAVYYAVSRDGGASFAAERKADDGSCECCRIALAAAPDGSAVMFWRHVFAPNIRDHAIARLGPQGVLQEPVRVSWGDWRIDACPHHGPALARGGDWGWHLAWYDGNEAQPGLYYARIDGKAWVASPPLRFGDADAQAGHPALLSSGEQVFLAWKELTEAATVVVAMASDDGGRNWSAPRRIAQTAGAADNPFLLSDGKAVYLSWNTQQEGYRLLDVASLQE